MSDPQLSKEGEEVWCFFHNQMESLQGFALVVLFSTDASVADLFRKRLSEAAGARTAPPRPDLQCDPRRARRDRVFRRTQ